MKYQGVIFDLDGTLLNTIEDIRDSLNTVLARHGYEVITTEECLSFVGNGSSRLLERALRKTADKSPEREAFAEILGEYVAYYGENYSVKTRPYEGISSMLESLMKENFKLGVFSNKPQNIVSSLVAEHFPKIPFGAVLGQRKDLPLKPSPEGAFLASELMGVPPEKCIFVGDSHEDRLTGLNAGMRPIGVSWGFRTGSYLKELGAEFCVDSSEELFETIRKLSLGVWK